MNGKDGAEQTLSRYAWGFDFDDLEMLADCFSEDADVVFPGGFRGVGRAACRQELDRRRQDFRNAGTTPWHLITNFLVLEESADEVHVRSFYTLVVGGPEGKGATVTSVGWYDDHFANEGDRWRIKRREVKPGASNRQH